MRVLKFRAWQQYAMQMFEVTGMVWSAAIDRKFSRLELLSVDGNYTIRNVTGAACNNYILMQYTGFKDRNGREIYEGDILFSHALDGSRTNDDYHLADAGVALPAGSLFFAHVKKDPLSVPIACSDTGSLEVIGNLYEHPQLLEVQP